MKCKDCNFTSGTDDTIRCSITGKEHALDFKCDCEPIRIRREKEARIKSDGITATNAIKALREKLFGPQLDLQYVYDTLTKVSIKVVSPELCEVIDYIVEFL